MDKTTFGKKIKQARLKLGFSQRELAAKIKINFTYLSKLETDKNDYPPSEEVIEKIANALNLDTDELTQLSGKITEEDIAVLKSLYMNHKEMPKLLRFLANNPDAVARFIDLNCQKTQ